MSDFDLQLYLTAGADGLCPAFLDTLPVPWWMRREEGAGYDLSDEALVAAIKAALVLGQPLIVAGDPGVGKTSLATAVAKRLGLFLHEPLQVKSSYSGMELFYRFDEVGRFRDGTRGGRAPLSWHGGIQQAEQEKLRGLRDYVRLSSLGMAILWSAGPDAVVAVGTVPLSEILGEEVGEDRVTLRRLFPDLFAKTVVARDGTIETITVSTSRRSAVLLDELDKAPRDAPNDILGELEKLRFRIEELDITIAAAPAAWPFILITSNSERNLPDAFLRRCVFHWIDFPEETRLWTIAASRFEASYNLTPECALVKSAVTRFVALRNEVENKRPSTAELIAFLAALVDFGYPVDEDLPINNPRVTELFGIMIKTRVDRAAVGLATEAF